MCFKKKSANKGKIESKKAILKKAEQSASFLIDTIENTNLCNYIYREDYVSVKRIKAVIEKMLIEENK